MTTSDIPTRAPQFTDTPVNVKIVLSGLWVAMLFVFAYVDIFAFFRADVIEGALAGEISAAGFTIDQAFLLQATLYILVPSLMVVASLVIPARANRVINLVTSPLYAVTVLASIFGESWGYYILGSIVEIALLLAVTCGAYRWPRRWQ